MSDAEDSLAREQLRGLQSLADLGTQFRGDEGLTQLLHRIAGRAKDVAKADFAAISVFGEGGHLDRFVHVGMPEDTARKIGAPPVGRGLLGALAEHDRAIRLADLALHHRFTGWPDGHPDMCAFLGVPIRAGGETIGSLYMTRMRGAEPFSDADEFAATVLGLQVALAVSTAISHERASRVQLLEERVSIGHDLHDGTIQSLYALALEWDAIGRREDASPDEFREMVRSSVAQVNDLIGDIRNYIQALERDVPETAPDLAQDLSHVVRRLVPEGIDVILNLNAPALHELMARQVEDLLFIAREAVSNAVRHGHPTKIAIDVRQTPGETAVTVQDNGEGFDQFNARRGLGMVTMQTRAERLGAGLVLMSLPGMGTTVRITLPRVSA